MRVQQWINTASGLKATVELKEVLFVMVSGKSNIAALFQMAQIMFKCRKSLCSLCLKYQTFGLAGNSNTSGLIFVAETKSWRDAQNYCRGLSSDLISIHSAEENEAVHNVSVSQNVWIGLFKDPWKWSDGSESSFRYWKPNQPNYRRGQNCTAAIFKDEGQWNDLNCARNRKFVCRGGKLLYYMLSLSVL